MLGMSRLGGAQGQALCPGALSTWRGAWAPVEHRVSPGMGGREQHPRASPGSPGSKWSPCSTMALFCRSCILRTLMGSSRNVGPGEKHSLLLRNLLLSTFALLHLERSAAVISSSTHIHICESAAECRKSRRMP